MGASPKNASARGQPRSPREASSNTPPRQDSATAPDAKDGAVADKAEASSSAEATKPLAPPPRPGQQPPQSNNTPDYFSTQVGGSLSLEPNPFEQSFGGGGPETPGGTKLPSVAALTSPSSLLPGSNATPFNWGGGSLRTGPLSPAMLSGPANDYFSDTHHLRGGFPTPNESSLRTGLTPGGSGSMFPAASPSTQALFAQLAGGGGATPSTLDFHRTALSAAAKRDQSNGAQPPPPPQAQASAPAQPQAPQAAAPPPPQAQQPQQAQHAASVSRPPDMPNGAAKVKAEPKPAPGPFDPHDNDAANGLYMLAQGDQGRNNSSQTAGQPYSVTSAPSHAHPAPSAPAPPMHARNAGSIDSGRGGSEGSIVSEEHEQAKPNNVRARGRRNNAAPANGRRKADEAPAKAPPSKKARGGGGGGGGGVANGSVDLSDDDDDDEPEDGGSKAKMTDEEKRKNFLERNRVAALKCRQRKKQWLANLQSKVEMFSAENDALSAQVTQLREEVVNLKTLLLAHKDCPVTQQQGMHGAFLSQVVEPFNAPMNPYNMASGQMPNQQVMAGQNVPRRFS